MHRSGFRQRLREGAILRGLFVQIPSPEIIEIAGHAGLDYAILDLEHGAYSLETAAGLARAADAVGLTALVRVARCDEVEIGKALDLGVGGVIVPRIQTAADARAAVAAARYAPEGARGACPCVRESDYGALDGPAFYRRANEAAAVILLVEGTEGVEHYPEILAQAADAVLLGPVDLAHSLGLPGQEDHPRVRAELTRMVGAAREANVAVGVFSWTPDDAARWQEVGATFLPIGVDARLIRDAFRRLLP